MGKTNRFPKKYFYNNYFLKNLTATSPDDDDIGDQCKFDDDFFDNVIFGIKLWEKTDCHFSQLYNNIQDNSGDFDWDAEEQGIILGAFYYGYIATQVENT